MYLSFVVIDALATAISWRGWFSKQNTENQSNMYLTKTNLIAM